jgi:hypothetical protein
MRRRSRAGGEPIKTRRRKTVTLLLNELRQSLEQQTATSEVLSVISSSPGELEPVFQAMLENAVRICGAKFGGLALCEGDDELRRVALYNAPLKYAELHQRAPLMKIRAVIADFPGTFAGSGLAGHGQSSAALPASATSSANKPEISSDASAGWSPDSR